MLRCSPTIGSPMGGSFHTAHPLDHTVEQPLLGQVGVLPLHARVLGLGVLLVSSALRAGFACRARWGGVWLGLARAGGSQQGFCTLHTTSGDWLPAGGDDLQTDGLTVI